jgi:fibronectin type 3 domain-containing protein
MKYLFFTVLSSIIFFSARAQDSLGVSVRANVKKDGIQLRWAVNSPLAWKQTNRFGFRVERYTVVRNKEILAQAEKIVLTPQPLKPQPLDHWKTLATGNNYAAVIAQALYGQSFQLSGDDAKGVSRMMALAQELEQRYLVSMYAADLCYPAAVLAGWGLEDQTAKLNERYLYRVIPVPGEKMARIAMGSVYVSLDDYQLLPQPQELTAIFGNKSVMLAWNYQLLGNVYNSYFIEKSGDGKTFTRLSDTPFTNLNGKEGKPNERMYYMDTLVNNGVPVHYRLVGVTAFGEEGPPSMTVRGQGKNTLAYVPHIQGVKPTNTGGVDLAWEFDQRGNNQIKGFELQYADNDHGPFRPVLKGIAPTARKVVFDGLQASNYLVIAAIPHEGEPVLSFPVLVQPADTLPPATPVGLKGTVDSLGIVRLSWTPNTEKDLLGYRMYRGQTQGEERIPLTDVVVRGNQFVDTLDVHNLNSKVYYAITAVDKRYNQSEQSAVAELRKPDLVPPSPPVITSYQLTDQGIRLEWITGQEENIASLQLYRRERGSDENQLIRTLADKNAQSYTDETTEADRFYQYSLKAVTLGGLASQPSPTVTVQARGRATELGKITEFAGKVSRKDRSIFLSWKHTVKDAQSFELYKGEVGKGVSLWKVTKAFEQQVQDADVLPGVQYEYVIRAVLTSGKTGSTAKVSVKN